MHTISHKKLLMLKPSELKVSKNQIRNNFDNNELKILADSIAVNGIIQPLSVRKVLNGKYEIITGERRYRAALIAGIRRIPCILHNVDHQTVAIYSIVENMQRSELGIFEQAEALEKLTTVYGMSQSEVSAKIGIAQSTVSNKIRILKLEEKIKKRIEKNRLTERHARALLRIEPSRRNEALDYIIENALNVSQTEEYVEELINPKLKKELITEPTRKFAIGDVRLFYNSLSKLVETLQSAGVDANTKKTENDKYIEYKVRIKKEQIGSNKCKQLKIC